MRRFIGNIDKNSYECTFDSETLHHMKVVRLEKGEHIEVLSSDKKAYVFEVVSPYPLNLKYLPNEKSESRELPFQSILACPLLKRDNFEFMLLKSVELGVSDIYPFISSRVIKRVSKEEFEEKRERFEKIMMEGVEQSNRNCLPILHPLYSYDEIFSIKADKKLFAYEDEAIHGISIPSDLFKDDLKSVISLFGPEGGFSSEEAKKAVDNGYIAVSLGKRILRAETAGLNMLSVVDYLGEKHE